MWPLRLMKPLRRVIGLRNVSTSVFKLNSEVPELSNDDNTENGYAHKILRDIERYNVRLARELVGSEKLDGIGSLEEIRWKDLSALALCRSFAKISLDASAGETPISDTKYNDMCASIAIRLPELDDRQLKSLLASLTLWPPSASFYEPNFLCLWKGIDGVLMTRLKEYTVDRILEFVDLWYQLHLTRKSDFVFHGLNKITRKPKRLRSDQVVKLLFYQNVIRKVSKNIEMFPVEEKLAEVINDLTIEEIGVACLGFFKTKNPIHSVGLVDAIVSKLIKHADTIPNITVASIAKALRYQLPYALFHRISGLMDSFVPQVPRLSVQGSVHLALMLTTSQTFHRGILDAVAEKIVQNIDSARLKDIEKAAFPLSLLNHEPKTSQCFYETVKTELSRPEREPEFSRYPKSFMALLHFLSLKRVFVDHLIDRVLDMNYLRAKIGKAKYVIPRDILFLDTAVELEHPAYNGNRLPTDVRNYLSKRYSAFLPDPERRMTKHMAFEYEVMQTLERLTNANYSSKYLLPNHSRADHVVRVGTGGEYLPIPEDLAAIENFTGPIWSPDRSFVAVVPLSRNMYIKNLDNAPNGESVAKIRQLKILGFSPAVVSSLSWPEGSDEEKEKYLHDIIRSSSVPS